MTANLAQPLPLSVVAEIEGVSYSDLSIVNCNLSSFPPFPPQGIFFYFSKDSAFVNSRHDSKSGAESGAYIRVTIEPDHRPSSKAT